MEVLLSAVLGEAISRSINFFIGKCSKPKAQRVEDRLRRVLLRAQVIIDEAMGRQITNQAILLQLDKLRGAVHRGYYILDTFMHQSHSKEGASKDQVLSKSLSMSKVNPLKPFCSYNRNTHILDQLQKSLDSLSDMVLDVDKAIMLLVSYPRLYRQPYSMHLVLSNCMFGRHMEAELAIKFLLHTQPQGPQELEVLLVVGPGKVGKSTLVAHVCNDERVRAHFSQVIWLHHDFADDELTSREGCALKLQNHIEKVNKENMLLVVVDLVGDLTEDSWNRLYFSLKRCMPRGSKIIVTSRSGKAVRFGTTWTLTLKYLPVEAFWYFFRTLVFGSMDPEMHPRHVQIAMEIARLLNGSLIGTYIALSLLRDNFDIQFWCKFLAFFRGLVHKHFSKFGERPSELLNNNRPTRLWRMCGTSDDFVIHHQYQRSSLDDLPKITFEDVVLGRVMPCGKFDALVWRSQIPPYYVHVHTCQIQALKTTGVKRKRSMGNGARFC